MQDDSSENKSDDEVCGFGKNQPNLDIDVDCGLGGESDGKLDGNRSRTVVDWNTHVDDETGQEHYEHRKSGKAVYTPNAKTFSEDNMRVRLRRVILKCASGAEGEHTSFWELVRNRFGDWAEVCDTDGSVLGEEYKGRTVYWNTSTHDAMFSRPPMWVRLQAQGRDAAARRSTERGRQQMKNVESSRVSTRRRVSVIAAALQRRRMSGSQPATTPLDQKESPETTMNEPVSNTGGGLSTRRRVSAVAAALQRRRMSGSQPATTPPDQKDTPETTMNAPVSNTGERSKSVEF